MATPNSEETEHSQLELAYGDGRMLGQNQASCLVQG
jgi:hypothetical protein